jgi:hypothetical protein
LSVDCSSDGAGLLFQRGISPNVVYTFKHALGARRGLRQPSQDQATMLHRRIAEALRDEVSERAKPEPEVIAYHFTEAGLSEIAILEW